MASQAAIMRVILVPIDGNAMPLDTLLALPAIQNAITNTLAGTIFLSTIQAQRLSTGVSKSVLRIEMLETAAQDTAFVAALAALEQALQAIRITIPGVTATTITPITEPLVTWSYPVTSGF